MKDEQELCMSNMYKELGGDMRTNEGHEEQEKKEEMRTTKIPMDECVW